MDQHGEPYTGAATLQGRRWRALRWLYPALLLLLHGCGGGSSSDNGESNPPNGSATAIVSPSVRTIEAPGTIVVSDDRTTVSMSAAQASGFKPGDVIVSDGAAMKLGAYPGLDGTGSHRFQLHTPTLNELYSAVELDGTFDWGGEFVEAASVRARPLAWGLKNSKCLVSNTVQGTSKGIRCDFDFRDTAYPLVTVKGYLEAGAVVARFRKYNPLTGSGEADIEYALGGKVILGVQKTSGVGSFSEEAKGKACSDALRQTGNGVAGRFLIASLPIPLGATGMSLVVPVCISVGAKADFTGEILSIAPNTRFKVLFREGSLPTLVPPTTTATLAGGSDDSTWGLAAPDTGVAVGRAAGSVELAVESSLEYTAFKVAYTGVGARLVGTAELAGRFAPALVAASSSLGTVRTSPQACATLKLAGRLHVDAYGSLPAAAALGLPSDTQRRLVDWEIDKFQGDFGYCGKSTVSMALTSSPNPAPPGAQVAVRLEAKPAPTAEEIAYDEIPSGEVTVRRSDGSPLCTVTLDARGQAGCTAILPMSAGALSLTASYPGSNRYKVATAEYALFVEDVSGIVLEDRLATAEASCATVADWPNRFNVFYYTYDGCTKASEPTARCIGSACANGRFFATVTRYTASYRYEDIPTPKSRGPCGKQADEVQDNLAQGRTTPEFIPGRPASSDAWHPISTAPSSLYPSAAGTRWPLLTGFPLSFKRNVRDVHFDPSFDGLAQCVLSGYNFTLDVRIYDSLQKTYQNRSYSISVP